MEFQSRINLEKEANGESSVKAVSKKPGIQSPESKIGHCITESRDLVNHRKLSWYEVNTKNGVG